MRRALTIARIAAVYLLLGFVTTWAVAWGLALLPSGRIDWPQRYDVIDNGPWRSIVNAECLFSIGTCRVVFTSDPSNALNNQSFDWWQGHNLQSLRIDPTVQKPRDLFKNDPPKWNDLNGALQSPFLHHWGKRHIVARVAYETPWTEGIDDARGFPFPALWCSWRIANPVSYVPRSTGGQRPVHHDLLFGGINLPDTTRVGMMDMVRPRALPYNPIWSGLALNTAFYALVFFAVVRTLRSFKRGRRFARGLCPRCRYDREFDYRLPCPECGDEPRAKRRECSVGAAELA